MATFEVKILHDQQKKVNFPETNFWSSNMGHVCVVFIRSPAVWSIVLQLSVMPPG